MILLLNIRFSINDDKIILHSSIMNIVTKTYAFWEKKFFEKNGLMINWKEFEKLDEAQKINTLSMIAPISNEEKQKLLESLTIKDKIDTLENIISFYLHEADFKNQTVQ